MDRNHRASSMNPPRKQTRNERRGAGHSNHSIKPVKFAGVDRNISPVAVPDEFLAPDWMSGNYWVVIRGPSNDQKQNFNRLVTEIVDVQTNTRENSTTWCGDNDINQRLTAASYKLASISPEMASAISTYIKSVTGFSVRPYALDWGCGDGSVGMVFGSTFNVPMVFGDITNVIFASLATRTPFVKIALDGTVDTTELSARARGDPQNDVFTSAYSRSSTVPGDSGPNITDYKEPLALKPIQLPTIITMMHSIHHFENATDPRYCPDAIASRVRRARDILQNGGLLIIREHDVGSVDSADTAVDDRGKIATVCLTHIKYEKNESTTSHIRDYADAVDWLDNYRLGLTSAPRMCAIITSCGFELVCATAPTGKDFSYYAMFRKV